MAKYLLSTPHDNSTLANFIAWAGNTTVNTTAPGTWHGIAYALGLFGWVQTADTGQVDWDTISSVPGASSFVYEVWQTNDSFTSQPIFLKIEYGSTSSSTVPNIAYTVGTGSDGSGNITGTNTSRQLIRSASPGTFAGQDTYFMNCYLSGDASRFCFVMFDDLQNTHNAWPMLFSIERNVTSTGVYTNTYFTVLAVGFSNNPRQQHLLFSGSATPAETTCFLTIQPRTANNANGNITANGKYGNAVSPVFPLIGFMDYPGLNVQIGYFTDFVNGAPTTLTVYGAAHNYIACVTSTANFYVTGISGQNGCVLLRFE